MTPPFIEGRIAYLEDRDNADNPYLTEVERSIAKDEWNTQAQEWDDGWCEAHEQDDDEED